MEVTFVSIIELTKPDNNHHSLTINIIFDNFAAQIHQINQNPSRHQMSLTCRDNFVTIAPGKQV